MPLVTCVHFSNESYISRELDCFILYLHIDLLLQGINRHGICKKTTNEKHLFFLSNLTVYFNISTHILSWITTPRQNLYDRHLWRSRQIPCTLCIFGQKKWATWGGLSIPICELFLSFYKPNLTVKTGQSVAQHFHFSDYGSNPSSQKVCECSSLRIQLCQNQIMRHCNCKSSSYTRVTLTESKRTSSHWHVALLLRSSGDLG